WKKEISFGRKKKAAEPEPEPVADEPASEEEPAWTRAVSFGRKGDPEPLATVPEEPAVEGETRTRAVAFGQEADPEPPEPEESGATGAGGGRAADRRGAVLNLEERDQLRPEEEGGRARTGTRRRGAGQRGRAVVDPRGLVRPQGRS